VIRAVDVIEARKTASEESAAGRPLLLHGLQLWIALPEPQRHGESRFAHHAGLPSSAACRSASAC